MFEYTKMQMIYNQTQHGVETAGLMDGMYWSEHPSGI